MPKNFGNGQMDGHQTMMDGQSETEYLQCLMIDGGMKITMLTISVP